MNLASVFWVLACCAVAPASKPQAQARAQSRLTASPNAALTDAAQATAALPPRAQAVVARMLRDNNVFIKRHDPRYFDSFRDGQTPDVTLVACADARFQEGDLDQTPDGQLFTVRNIGNQVDLNEGSVEYGVRHLRTPVLLIVGHVACGAVRAALDDYAAASPALRRELNGLHLSLRRTDAALPLAERWLQGVEANVHQQVQDALQMFAPEVARGELTVLGAVYDFRDDLRRGKGRLVLVNVNGSVTLALPGRGGALP